MYHEGLVRRVPAMIANAQLGRNDVICKAFVMYWASDLQCNTKQRASGLYLIRRTYPNISPLTLEI